MPYTLMLLGACRAGGLSFHRTQTTLTKIAKTTGHGCCRYPRKSSNQGAHYNVRVAAEVDGASFTFRLGAVF